MKNDVLRRLSTLEQQMPPAERVVLWRSIFRPGAHGAEDVEPMAVKNLGGWYLPRQAGESVDAFRIRAKIAAPANERGVAVIHEVCEEEATCAT